MTDDRTEGAEGPVWIADDDRSIRWVLEKALTRAGITVRAFDRGDAVLRALEDGAEAPLVLVSDVRMPGISGTDLLTKVAEAHPEMPVIIMTAFSDLESAVTAFRGGAFEYLAKPFDIEGAVELIRRAMAEGRRRRPTGRPAEAGAAAPAAPASKPTTKASADRSSTPAWSDDMVGAAPAMQELYRAIGRLAKSTATVLITGESGVGKEVVAREIWRHSPRSHRPYVAINMAAIPKELLESELFGHEKGAFTGAVATHQGRFEQARGGTIFLDEIGDMPMELQTRLLRVLSSGSFYRVGGRELLTADVRVLAATNRDLEAMVAEGRFREDLYHRLHVIRLRIPPLRERREDVAPLCRHFLTAGAARFGVEPRVLTPEALAKLEAFPFPGNVRQLENICRWLLVMAPSIEVRPEDLPPEVLEGDALLGHAGHAAHPAQTPSAPGALKTPGAAPAGCASAPETSAAEGAVAPSDDWCAVLRTEVGKRWDAMRASGDGDGLLWDALIDDFERTVILEALRRTRGRRLEAAAHLGLGRNTLSRKIRELGLEPWGRD